MFHAINSVKVKNSILHSFSCVGGRLRILIATVAFCMGIDCPDIVWELTAPTFVISFIGDHHQTVKVISRELEELAEMVFLHTLIYIIQAET